MQAITTRFHGPTDCKGPRISATSGGGHRVYIDVPDNMHSGSEDTHGLAAVALCKKLGWTGRMVAGATRDGYAFVFLPRSPKDIYGTGPADDFFTTL